MAKGWERYGCAKVSAHSYGCATMVQWYGTVTMAYGMVLWHITMVMQRFRHITLVVQLWYYGMVP